MNLKQLPGYAVALMLLAFTVVSCSDDDNGDGTETPEPIIASFSYAIEDYDVAFTNETLNADDYSWDFGDGESSSEESPSHTYAEAGEYTVVLTASNSVEDKTAEETIVIEEVGQDPMTLLTGGSSKTWVLAPQKNAVSFGNPAGVWYDGLSLEDTAVELWWGNLADQVEGRSCLFDNEFTFTSEGAFTRETNGSLWKEWKVFDEVSGEGCTADGEDLITRMENDVTAWRDGSFTFELETWSGEDTIFTYTLATAGAGGYIGHYTSGVEFSDYDVHDEHNYGILSIAEDKVELISWGWGGDAIDNEIDPNTSDRWYKVVLVPKSE
ncbi:PKD domain-containing protein [Reichenbachiella faecimaris]|uniref:PKD domain-containing protein n=1 Tax=Reichenbachiella faecimaris TaxID=692418 RepID=A0A1W2G906_REIFA|nr:PKD domain-containing protein [Reichenbachiella faecimaris]SMD32776.1 PKD domain-containing protein [Reichenbachiella faecimaris]